MLYGTQLPDDDGESAARILINKIIELPGENARAEYLTKVLNESETQILADALIKDIHKFSQTPNFSDEQFAGNASGVAIKYKLLSLDNLAKVKERFLISGLRSRIKLFVNILNVKGRSPINVHNINIILNRSLPANEFETAQMVATLSGMVSNETLLTQLPFIKDAGAEAENVKKENLEKAKEAAQAYGNFPSNGSEAVTAGGR